MTLKSFTLALPQSTSGGGGGGSVNSVSGTLNRTTSSGGADPVIDISPNYVGQSSITTLGTIGTGVWQGTPIADAYLTAIAWAKITGTPTTLSGYGITDAYTKTQSDARYLQLSGGTLTGNLNGVTPTQLGYLTGITSDVQTQLNGKQAAFTSQSANLVYRSGDSGGIPAFGALSLNDMPVLSTPMPINIPVSAGMRQQQLAEALQGQITDKGNYNYALMEQRLKNTYKKLCQNVAITGSDFSPNVVSFPRLNVMSFIDSIGYFKPQYLLKFLGRKFKYVNGLMVNFLSAPTTGNVTSHDDNSDTSYWFNGQWLQINDNTGTITTSVAAPSNDIRVYYLKGPSFGKFKLQTISVPLGTVVDEGTEIDCYAPTLQGAVATITKSGENTTYQCKILGTDGVTVFVGVNFQLTSTTQSSMSIFNWNKGGLGFQQSSLCPDAITNPIFADIKADLIFFEGKEGADNINDYMYDFVDRLNAQYSGSDWVLIGTTPQFFDDASNVAQNTAQKELANAKNLVYWDGYTQMKDYATMLSLGLNGDGVHVSTDLSNHLAASLYFDLGFDKLFSLPSTREVKCNFVQIGTQLSFWNNSLIGNLFANVGNILPDTTISTTPRLLYDSLAHRFRDMSGNVLADLTTTGFNLGAGIYDIKAPGCLYYGFGGGSTGDFDYLIFSTTNNRFERRAHIGTGNGLSVGSKNLTFRQISSGGDFLAKFLLNSTNSVATGAGIGYTDNDGFIGLKGDGTRQIAVWAMKHVNTFNGDDSSGVGFFYKPASAILTEGMRLSRRGNLGVGVMEVTAKVHASASDGTYGSVQIDPTITLAVTGATGTGSVVTLTFTAQPFAPFNVGQIITIAGMTPSGYNATKVQVVTCNTTSVQYQNITTASFVSGGTVSSGTLLPTPRNGTFEYDNVDLLFTINSTRKKVAFQGDNTMITHLIGSGSAPTISAGAGAGTGPTVAISGTDLAGYITITTGTLPTVSAVVATVTFNNSYTSTPKTVIVTAANANAAALAGTTSSFVDQAGITAAKFDLTAGSAGLTATLVYKFYYMVVQ